MLWDIFCNVIDNHGDIGVCWRLAAELGARGERVRLRVDDASALAWMAPQGANGVDVLSWTSEAGPGDVVVEAFGCELPEAFQAAIARLARHEGIQPAWINLEYLTAESFAERTHGLPSPVMSGPAAGLTKHFFYPGFTPRTGGLIREGDLLQRQAAFDRGGWLSARGIAPLGELLVSMFCYEPAAMPDLVAQLATASRPVRLLVTAGRATGAVQAVLGKDASRGNLAVTYLPLMPHPDFDHLLWACDFNFVRGEDSLVRALWAGAPFVWQLYPQHDDAHHAKLEAFLDWLEAPAAECEFYRAWNGITAELPPIDFDGWGGAAASARERLLSQTDLVTQLLRFARQPANTSSAAS